MADDGVQASTLKVARKATAAAADGGAKRAASEKQTVNPARVRELKGGEVGHGPVLYW